jgi:hypothetical protein
VKIVANYFTSDSKMVLVIKCGHEYSQHTNIQKLPGDSESGELEYDSLFLGLETPADRTAETSKNEWLAVVSHVAEVFFFFFESGLLCI